MADNRPLIGADCICPICEKHFKFSEDSKFFIKGGYTCSKECFIKRTYEVSNLKAEENKDEESTDITVPFVTEKTTKKRGKKKS